MGKKQRKKEQQKGSKPASPEPPKETIAPKDMREQIGNITPEQPVQKLKCGAFLPKCKGCGYKFKKEEIKCPQCKTERPVCEKWALKGTKKCKLHGGAGGRPIEVDPDTKIPLKYDQDAERLTKKNQLIKFYDHIEKCGEKSILILGLIEEALELGKGEQYDIEDLSNLFAKNQDMFKTMIKYGSMLNAKKEAEKPPVYEGYPPEVMNVLKRTLMERCFAIAVNNFMLILKQEIKDEEIINKIYEGLSEPLKKAFKDQEVFFNNSREIVEQAFPELVGDDKQVNGGPKKI